MTIYEALDIIKHHQAWRLGDDSAPTQPKVLTLALDTLIAYVEATLEGYDEKNKT